MPENQEVCCPVFDPAPWDEKPISFEGRRFIKDRVKSFLHIPLDFGPVMVRNMQAIEAAGLQATGVVLCDERSLWGSDVYIEVSGAVPGREMAAVPGEFLAKVFEGPYHKEGQWMREMKAWVAGQGKTLKHMLVFYTTCPKCAKERGKNYVVLLAEV